MCLTKRRQNELTMSKCEQSNGRAIEPALVAAIKSVIDVLTDEMLTAESRAHRIVSQIADMSFSAPGASAAMAGSLRQFTKAAPTEIEL
jgi:hypothetical protein